MSSIEQKDVEELDLAADKVFTWPHLIRMEFLVALAVMLGMIVWSLVLNAPLEEAANPALTPNPSKAPWYFLGLQEMLVYFDPWIAGVVLPSFIIVGLMAIPYVDVNPKGNGYYTFAERKLMITGYCFGFLVLWIALIIIGVFFRGPGWNFFMPWEYWDAHKVVALVSVDLDSLFGIRNQPWRSLFGLSIIGAYYSLGVLFYFWKREADLVQKLGVVRYATVAFLTLTMMALPIKMILRIVFNIKYICVTPWFNI